MSSAHSNNFSERPYTSMIHGFGAHSVSGSDAELNQLTFLDPSELPLQVFTSTGATWSTEVNPGDHPENQKEEASNGDGRDNQSSPHRDSCKTDSTS
jgi:hypothetical protein